MIDEVRISGTTRSSNWVWASWLSVASNDSFVAYGSVQDPSPPIPVERRILIDFGSSNSYRGASVTSPDGNGNSWNSVWSGAFQADLLDSGGTATPIDLGFDFDGGADSYNGPDGAVDANALGPLGGAANAVNDYYVSSRFQLQGLDTGRTYRLTFFGSHKYSDNDATVYRVFSDAGYSALLASVSLNVQSPGFPALHNSNRVAVIDSIQPPADGILRIAFQGSLGGAGYLNAMEVSLLGALSGYDAWSTNYPGLGGPHVDDDGDGLENLGEFAFGGNPTNIQDKGYKPSIALVETTGAAAVAYGVVRRSDSGLVFEVESSTNLTLGAWTVAPIAASSTGGPVHADFEAVTNLVPMAGPQLYLRTTVR